MRLFIDHGATIDSRTYQGRTPLYLRVASGLRKDVAVEAARLLLESGSDANSRDNGGRSILGLPVSVNTVPSCAFCCNTEPPSTTKILVAEKRSFIGLPTITIWKNTPKTMELLLEHGANPRIRNYQGNLPLDVACARLASDKEDSARNINVICILFQRMIGDASLRLKQQNVHIILRTWRRNGVACDELLFLPGTPHGDEHGIQSPRLLFSQQKATWQRVLPGNRRRGQHPNRRAWMMKPLREPGQPQGIAADHSRGIAHSRPFETLPRAGTKEMIRKMRMNT